MLLEQDETDTPVNCPDFVKQTVAMNLIHVQRWAGHGPLKDVLDQLATDLVAGRMTSCGHLRHPQPVIVSMAFPDHLYCRSCCRAQLMPRLGEVQQRNWCDACSKSSPKPVASTAVHVGSVILVGKVCNRCNAPSQSLWAGLMEAAACSG